MARRTSKPRSASPALDALFGAPLEEFTAQRNALSRTLTREGHPEQARQVKGLSKPPVAVWVVNQLARRGPEAVGALLDAWEAATHAQAQAVAHGQRGGLRDALAAERQAVARVLASAEGDAALEALVSRHATTVNSILTAAVRSSDETRSQLRTGTLRQAPVSSAFGLSGDAIPPSGSEVPARAPRQAARKAAKGTAHAAGRSKRHPGPKAAVPAKASKPAARTGAPSRAEAARVRQQEQARARAEQKERAQAAVAHRRELAQRTRTLATARKRAQRARDEVVALETRLDAARAEGHAADEAVHAAEQQLRALESADA